MPSSNPTPYAVYCHGHDFCDGYYGNCGTVFLTAEEYYYQMSKPDHQWFCPACGCSAEWDDDNYERYMITTEDTP